MPSLSFNTSIVALVNGGLLSLPDLYISLEGAYTSIPTERLPLNSIVPLLISEYLFVLLTSLSVSFSVKIIPTLYPVYPPFLISVPSAFTISGVLFTFVSNNPSSPIIGNGVFKVISLGEVISVPSSFIVPTVSPPNPPLPLYFSSVSALSVITPLFTIFLSPWPILEPLSVSVCASNPIVNGPTKFIVPLFSIVAFGVLCKVPTLEPPTKKFCLLISLSCVLSAVLIESIVIFVPLAIVNVPPPVYFPSILP